MKIRLTIFDIPLLATRQFTRMVSSVN